MKPFAVELKDVSIRYGRTVAVDSLSLRLPAGVICGLLGPNASGKTTLLSAIAAFRRPSSGSVLVDGEDPFENPRVMAGTCLIRESGDVAPERIGQVLEFASRLRPTWDQGLADRLLDRFELTTRLRTDSLSRGQRSALGATLGLASRAPLTMFDEVYLGMDAPKRYAFYDELLSDYLQHPRTIILSSHLISEIERLFEWVLVIDRSKLVLLETAEDLRSRAVRVTGRKERVEEFSTGSTILQREFLGDTASFALLGPAQAERERQATRLGLTLGQVSVQDLVVHLLEARKETK